MIAYRHRKSVLPRIVRSIPAVLLLFGVACASAPNQSAPPAASTSERPRLAVLLVIDQFREPYLEQYGDLFQGGFRRLLDQGRLYSRATHDHANTETAVGHATLSTGVYPMRHGVVANEWAERTPAGWVEVSNVGDSTVKIVGYPAIPGVSPRRLMREGLADWVVAADSRSQVASVSAKDRGAILPAAHARGQVYWFEPRAGRFVTSTYYRDKYPTWADEFTARALPRYTRDSVWASLIPAGAVARTSPDTAAWEGDGVHTFFPHRFADESRPGQFWQWFAATPMLDALTLEYARTMVTSLGLGKDDASDFLNVSLSQTDRVGHAFGPMSREQLDNLLRLDRELGEFFTFLDRTVGANQWTVALSADHGSLLAPETLPQPGEAAAGRRGTAAEKAQLKAIRDEAAKGPSDAASAMRTAAALRKLPFVAEAYTEAQLVGTTPADSFTVLERRSYYPGRAAADFSPFGVEVRFVEGWLGSVRGTSHGTPYWYDRHVPVLFMGPGIPAGRDTTRAATVDVAPTLASVLHVRVPTAVDGRPLSAVTNH